MGFLLAVLLVILNVLIAYFNARAVAPAFKYRSTMGWGMWAVTWSAVIQSVVGFSMPLILGGSFGALALGLLPAAYAKAAMGAWYLAVIVPVVGTGLILTVHSWIEAWRRRDLSSGINAAWNTYATASNMAGMGRGITDSFGAIGNVVPSFDDLDGDAWPLLLFLLAIAIVVFSLCGGAYATYKVIEAHENDDEVRPDDRSSASF